MAGGSNPNGTDSIYLRDTLTGTTTLESVTSAGETFTYGGTNPVVSADGRFIAFESPGPEPGGSNPNGTDSIYLRDTLTGTTTLESVTTAGETFTYGGTKPSISSDGRFIAFESPGPVPGGSNPNGTDSVYLRDTGEEDVTAPSVPTFLSSNSLTETYGTPFSFTVNTTGMPVPTISKLAGSGNLPAGVTLSDNGDGTATLGGSLSNKSDSGVYSFTIKAKNKAGAATQPFTLTVNKAPTLKNVANKTVAIGSPFSTNISAGGYPTPSLGVTGLPSGLHLADAGDGTGSISGTPASGTAGLYTVIITATNGQGSATNSFTIKVTS